MVRTYVAPAVLEVIDQSQFGAIPKSSTTQSLISMIHKWSKATDAPGVAVRILLLDHIDHNILVGKISQLRIPPGVARWICDFLMNRKQRVKLPGDIFSEWENVPFGVPQGTILGPWLFLLMINDLNTRHADLWKYVDDTSLAEVVNHRVSSSALQLAANDIECWSETNKLHLNVDKCKEFRIDFKKVKSEFDPILIHGKEVEVVNNEKVLGL